MRERFFESLIWRAGLTAALILGPPGCALGGAKTIEKEEPSPPPITTPLIVEPLPTLVPVRVPVPQPTETPPPSPTPQPSPSPTALTEAEILKPPKRKEVKEKLLVSRKICLDPGHDSYWVPGAVAIDEKGKLIINEHELTFKVAQLLSTLLEKEGAQVCNTRNEAGLLQITPVVQSTGAIEDLPKFALPRVLYMNQFGADLMLSIHFNSFHDPNVSGTEVYYSDVGPHREENKRLAQTVLEALVEEIRTTGGYPTINRGTKSDLYDRHPPEIFEKIVTHYGFDPGCQECKRIYVLGHNPLLPERGQWQAGALVEALFLSNPEEVAFLQKENAAKIIAQGLAKGIIRFFQTQKEIRVTPSGEIVRGNPQRKEIALTFDCGASALAIPKILEALHRENVWASFFLTGNWATENPNLVRRISKEGHQIANHSFAHPDFASLTPEQMIEELEKTEKIILGLTGKSTKPFWRAPYGSRNENILRIISEAGWPVHVYWSLDSGDWRPEVSPQAVVTKVVDEVANGTIVVLHCGSPQTDQKILEIIQRVKQKNFVPTTIFDLGS